MNTLIQALSAILEGVQFNLIETEIALDGTERSRQERKVSATELKEVFARDECGVVRRRFVFAVSKDLLAQFVEELRLELGRFINPETGLFGHAVFIGTQSSLSVTVREDGFPRWTFHSSPESFAWTVIRSAAVQGADTTCRLLQDWIDGMPARVHISTVLNGLRLEAPLSVRNDIQLVPLSLNAAELPRLPFSPQNPPKDFLGLSLLKLTFSAEPALFRPRNDGNEQSVELQKSMVGLNLDLLCNALSLQANLHVDHGLIWTEYPDATAFCNFDSKPPTTAPNWARLRPLRIKELRHDGHPDGAGIVPWDDSELRHLDAEEVCRTVEALEKVESQRYASGTGGAKERSLRIAADRWWRSKRNNAHWIDQYIDLRIALELLYVRDFVNGHNQELGFKLSLFGAWHLARTTDERRRIRRTLRDAYAIASQILHGGKIKKSKEGNLSEAQDLCRKGILKLLIEGPPPDWGDLVLGAGDNEPDISRGPEGPVKPR